MLRAVSLVLAATSVVNGQLPSLGKGALDSLLVPLMTKGIPFGPSPKGCSDYEVLVARGTGEPGPFGVVVGDLLIGAVTKALPQARGYAVQYPASLNMTVSMPSGVVDVVTRLNTQSQQCPKQKFALVGYSQGAGVMHNVFGPPQTYPGGPKEAPKLNSDIIPKIVALVMFGDPGYKAADAGMLGGGPKFPGPLYDRLKENCAPGDPICDTDASGFENHLNYAKDPWQKESADYIIAAFKGEPLPKGIRSAAEARAKRGGKPAGKVPRSLIA